MINKQWNKYIDDIDIVYKMFINQNNLKAYLCMKGVIIKKRRRSEETLD